MPEYSLFFTLLSLYLSTPIHAQGNWTVSPFNPFSLPLAVKSPYVNAWAPLGYHTTGSSPLNEAIPRLWSNVFSNIGWDAAILVDGVPYHLLGVAKTTTFVNASQQSIVFTPTQSACVFQAGPVNVTMTFMSPVEAKDLVHQSMPFSYLYFSVDSIDGNAHDLTIYSDVTGEWVTGNVGLEATWQINQSDDFVYLQMNLTSAAPYGEVDDRPQDATIYYCTKKSGGISWQIGSSDDIRASFASGVGLSNQAEPGTHHDQLPFKALSLSVHLGSISSTSEPIAFALGVVRDPVVAYTNESGRVEERSAYYWSQFTNIRDVIADVVNRSVDALSIAVSLDTQILADARQISSKYGDILSLATRQAMSAYEFTLSQSNGVLNTSDVKAFMKDMGGIGSGGVNAVDVLYSAMPIYLYLNPAILGYLLNPLLEQQEGSQYTNPYAAQDLGTRFPLAIGNPAAHNQGIEHSANMLIMSLAYAQTTGDGSLLAQHYGLLAMWADYLVNNAMNPGDETTSISDGIVSEKQANLMLKGVIGIEAMAKISECGGISDDKNKYGAIAKKYAQQWTSQASGSGQIVLSISSGSSGLIYNLYADKLLQLNLIDDSVYSMQTSFYQQQISLWRYGLPLDSANTSSISRSDWMMFAASTVSDATIRDAMISQVWEYAASNVEQNVPFPISYNPEDATSIAGENSPAQGAMFAPLALNIPVKPVEFSGGKNRTRKGPWSNSTGSSNRRVIIGATIGGFFSLMSIAVLLFFSRRHLHYQQRERPGGFTIDSPEPVFAPLRDQEGDHRVDQYQFPLQSDDNDAEPVGIAANTPHQLAGTKYRQIMLLQEEDDVGNGPVSVDSESEAGHPRARSRTGSQYIDTLSGLTASIQRVLNIMKGGRTSSLGPPPSYHDAI